MFKPRQPRAKVPRTFKGRIDPSKPPPRKDATESSHTLLERVIPSLGKGRKGAKTPTPAKPSAEYVGPDSVWFTDPHSFPHVSDVHEQLRFCIRYATLAPSSHNTQPWKFHVHDQGVDVLADRTRALPNCDPHDRELIISCGCALFFLRIAMRRFGIGTHTTILPDPKNPDLLARVDAGERTSPGVQETLLFDAIPRRRTYRKSFDDTPVPAPVASDLHELTTQQGALLEWIEGDDRLRLASLIAEGDVVQFNQPAFRRELALWMHHNRAHAHDGIPGYAMGMSELESLAAPLVVRTFDMGDGRAAKDLELIRHSPLIGVIGTKQDAPKAWIDTGQSLGAMLLRGTAAGLGSSYLNQPIEVPTLREHLARMTPGMPFPQLIIRMGYAARATQPPHTPRRPVADVLVRDDLPVPFSKAKRSKSESAVSKKPPGPRSRR